MINRPAHGACFAAPIVICLQRNYYVRMRTQTRQQYSELAPNTFVSLLVDFDTNARKCDYASPARTRVG
jgi:hypothetical protein